MKHINLHIKKTQIHKYENLINWQVQECNMERSKIILMDLQIVRRLRSDFSKMVFTLIKVLSDHMNMILSGDLWTTLCTAFSHLNGKIFILMEFRYRHTMSQIKSLLERVEIVISKEKDKELITFLPFHIQINVLQERPKEIITLTNMSQLPKTK